MRPEDIHPRHPGIGSSTSLMALESTEGDRSVGGVILFFPSGATKIVSWQQSTPITPTKEAAQKFATEVAESLQKSDLMEDLMRTNWVSVTAAIQKIILDFNDRVKIILN